jgi:hypothetical protein
MYPEPSDIPSTFPESPSSFCSFSLSGVISQLRGDFFGAHIRVNSKNPCSGQKKYLEGFPVAGLSRVTIRDSEDAFLGRIKALGGFALLGGSCFALLDGAGDSEVDSSIAEDLTGLEDRVRAIM